ncbi:MAG: DegT/DnrJ/EryC1/StrS family aminotransferase [Solirubrobacteraceae bacterium]
MEPPRVDLVDIGRDHAPIGAELEAAFARVLGAGSFVLGRELAQFEHEFASYCGTRDCVGVSSGTAALTLLLRAHGIGPGDEVIVPAHTFIASALAVAHVGATAVLADVDAASGLLDPDATRAMIGPRSSAVLAVHLYGQCCDIDALRAVTAPHGLLLLEDAAQAHGATFEGRRAGSLADGAAFSFYPSKNLGALGDGGAVCTNDEALAARIRRLRNLGQGEKGRHADLGYNERLDDLQAALLCVKLAHLDEWNRRRQAAARRYRAVLSPAVALVKEDPRTPSVHHLFPARLADRDRVRELLAAEGIQTGVHYAPAVHGHEAWKEAPLRFESVENAERWAAEEVSLPMHPHLNQDEIEYVAHVLNWAISAPRG